MSDRRFLVTGGTGLIGKAIEEVIAEENPQNEFWMFIGTKNADLTDYNACKGIFDNYRPTHVVHLAALCGSLYKHMRHNLEIFRGNMKINDNVLAVSHELGVEKVVSCLSTCIFPDKTTYPIDETMIHSGPPHESNFGFSYAKRMLDVMNHGYAVQYGHKYTSIIPTNTFGPHDNFSLEDGHVLAGLMHKCYLAQKEGKPLVIWGSGKALRQFVYSKDIARLIMWAARDYQEVAPMILSVGESDEVSIADAADMVAKAFKFKGEIVYDTTRSDGQYKKTASNAKLLRYRSDFEFTPLHKGIQETVDWFISNYETARK